MTKGPRFVDIATDYGLGLVGSVVVGGVAYAFGEIVLRRLAFGLWGTAVSSALAIGALCLGVVAGGGEPIFRRAQHHGARLRADARKQIWKGAFIGAPTVIALLSVAEMDWSAILASNHALVPIRILIVVVVLIQYVATSPVRLLVYTLGIPAEVVMILAAPVGAVAMRHFSALEPDVTDVPSPKRATDGRATNDNASSAD